MFRPAALVIAIICLISADPSTSWAEWWRFRGENGAGISADSTSLPVTWSGTENLAWKTELPGPGSSSPIVVGDRVFVTCWSGYGMDQREPGDQTQLRRHLICINAKNGETIWSKSVQPYLPEDAYGGMFAQHGYASHTPVSDGERVYVFFGKTGALAFDLEGQQLWQKSVGTESGPRDWGSASSPILYKNLLIVSATAESDALVALDKTTGEEVWRQEAAGFDSVWGTPVLVAVDAERTDLVIAVPNEIWALDPETGKLRWYCEGVPASSFCSSAVACDGVVYAMESGPGGGGGIAVRAGGQGDVTESHIVWRGNQSNRIGTPVVQDGCLFAFSNKMVSCFNAATGAERFKGRLTSSSQPSAAPEQPSGRGGFGGRGGGGGFGGQDYSSPVLADGKLYYTGRSGDIFVLKADETCEQMAVNRLTEDREDFSATPAVSDGRLFIRSSKCLYCVAKSE